MGSKYYLFQRHILGQLRLCSSWQLQKLRKKEVRYMLTMLLLATQTVAPKMLSIKQANIVIYTNQKKSKKKTNWNIHTPQATKRI